MTENPVPGSTVIAYLAGSPVMTVPASATLLEVAQALTEGDVGAVVVEDAELPVAMISERDVTHAVATGKDIATVTALEVGSTTLLWCDVTATVDEVAAQMRDHFVRHILVEEDGKLVGIVSARDLLGIYCPDSSFD
jgi:CBS domain-containing protein